MAKSLVALGSILWVGEHSILGVISIVIGCVTDIVTIIEKKKMKNVD